MEDNGKRTWYVLHVKPRTEKKVATFLSRYGLFGYLPTWTKVRKVQRRKVRTTLPLFPGYVFTRLFPGERRRMLETKLLVRTIDVPGPRALVHQLRQISRSARSSPQLRPAAPFRSGERVRIRYGALRGVEGYVKRDGAKASVVLNVEILSQAVEVSVDPADLERSGPARA